MCWVWVCEARTLRGAPRAAPSLARFLYSSLPLAPLPAGIKPPRFGLDSALFSSSWITASLSSHAWQKHRCPVKVTEPLVPPHSFANSSGLTQSG